MKPTILLLGGTGAMGDYLRPLLADNGFQVIVTSRSEREPEQGVRFVKGNGHDGDFVNDLMDKIHPDSVVDFMIYRTSEFAARRDDLLRRTGHYLFLSSYRVFAGTTPIVESSPRILDTLDDPDYLATDEYALAKARGEDLLRQAPTRNWTIIRPSIATPSVRLLRISPKKPSGSVTRLCSTPAAHCRAWGDAARAMPVPIDSAAMNTAAVWTTLGSAR